MSETLKDRIIKTLVDSQRIRNEDLEEAKALQKTSGLTLDKALIAKGLIKEEDLLVLLVRELNIPFINLGKYKIDPALKDIIPERIARQYKIVPLSTLENMLTIAVSDPLNVFVIDDLKNFTGREIDIVMSTHGEIMKAIDNYYGSGQGESVTDVSKDIQVENFEIITEQETQENVDAVVDESEKAPIIRMVNLIVKEALRQKASDIHLEPTADGTRVRFRVDGILLDVLKIPKISQNAVIVRIKIMARLDITTSQTPQDGRFKLKVSDKEVDFRVSLLPTTFGQKVVMRVLDKSNLALGLDGLGFADRSLKLLRESIKKPFGMILVTGPTGSGKSTTLYSIINELNSVDRNIITVEDPVEYQVEGLTQIQTRADIGLTFSEGLRAILRQSPDIVLVGEIRDNETADIAIKASLTGQLVFSTLHTNDAAGALTRLVDMGVEPFLVASSLVMVCAQRLCRKICAQCKEVVELPRHVLDPLGEAVKQGAVFYRGKGCESCRRTGYKGRMCVTEILDLDDQVREMLLGNQTSDAIKKYARLKKGMNSLWEDAMSKCLAGLTTLEEVMRITTND